ncbi:unnamed protein product [Ilex paraguariensis]|uniref:Trichome birefringence-like C-terminal domain-containing protein n=1 Tax=Ilex paraguariensis TaxID=185542 RepID=A0ABC8RZL7_9AQUA
MSRGEDWGMATDQNCYNETEPISEEGYWGSMTDVRMMQIAEAAIQELRTRGLKVQILNITQLSDYRKEAHPSIYRRQWVPLTEEQLSDPRRYADCVHWCLPGVPDVVRSVLMGVYLALAWMNPYDGWVGLTFSEDRRNEAVNPFILNSSKHQLQISPYQEYNTTIDFYWAPFLVESNYDRAAGPVHGISEQIVRVQAIEKHARHWTDADILVFDSYAWWRRPKYKILWGSFEKPDDGIYKEVDALRSYEMSLKTWSDWLDIHVDRNKTRLFFMSMSPTHEWGEEWGMAKGETCYNETNPISKEGYWGRGSDIRMMQKVGAAIEELKIRGLKVQFLNITQLSEYRKESHPSIYRKQWKPLTEEQLSDPRRYADCKHWCLPGVPDVWNEILYAYIFGYE